MCRVYKAKAGWYARLCYYHGNRRGVHVSVPVGYELQKKHYPRRSPPRSPREVRKKKEVARCIFCGSCLSRHNTSGVCSFCTEYPKRHIPVQFSEE